MFLFRRTILSTSNKVNKAVGSSRRNAASLLGLGCMTSAGLVAWSYYDKKDRHPRLSYAHFIPLKIRSIQRITGDSSLFSISLPEEQLPDRKAYPQPPDTPLQAIYIRQPELQIQRAYTPLDLDCLRSMKGGTIRFLVKRYKDGEVSDYLHRRAEGDVIWLRGPVRTWTLPPTDELVFIAGGTGITPMIQLLSQRESLFPRVKLIYCSSPSEGSLLSLIPQDSDCSTHHIEGRLKLQHLQQYVGSPNPARQIIVCGPEDFITDIAGKRGQNAQRDELGGMLKQLGWTTEQVKKL